MEPESRNPDEILENVGNLDTARMTLRWALERIRSLEKNLGETQNLLRDAVMSRDKAASFADSKKDEMAARTRALEEKERFVADMQNLLNDLFKGEVQVSEVIRQRREFEDEKKALEAQVRKRIDDVDINHKTELQKHNQQLAEIEATYAGALAQAQKRYHNQIEEIRKEHENELEEEKRKLDHFRKEALSEAHIREDQYHQKMLLLEQDTAKRRVGMEQDFQNLKTKIIEEERKLWADERAHLESELESRAEQMRDLQTQISITEARHNQNTIEQAKAARIRLEEMQEALREEADARLEAQRTEHQKHAAQRLEELAAARQELAAREVAFQTERLEIIAQQARLREAITAEHSQRVKEQALRHQAEIDQVRRSLQEAFDTERRKEQEQSEEDLDALRKFYDAITARGNAEIISARDRLLDEKKGFQTEYAKALQNAREQIHAWQKNLAVYREEEKARIQKTDQEYESRIRYIETLRTEEQKKYLQEIKTLKERVAQQEALRDQDNEAYRGKRRELEKAFETITQEKEARVRQQDIQELESVRAHFKKLFEERQREYEARTQELNAHVAQLRQDLSRMETEHKHALTQARTHAAPSWWMLLKASLALLLGPKVLAVMILLTAGTAAFLYAPWNNKGSDYTVPFSHPTSLVWQGDSLWATDWLEQSLYQMRLTDQGLTQEARYPVPHSRITGMALVGQYLFFTDSLNNEIQKWTIEEDRLRMLKTWESPGKSPSALYYDGQHLWSGDLLGKRIYQHVLDEELTILTSYPAEHAPIAFFANEKNFWSVDSQSRLVFQRRWDDALTPIHAYRHPELAQGKKALSAFTFHGKDVWLARDGSTVLLKRPFSSFRKEPARSRSGAY